MVNRDYLVCGTFEGVNLDFLKFAEGLFRCMEEADKSPEVAREVFLGLKSHEEFMERIESLYTQADLKRQRELGPAYNYALVNTFFKHGAMDKAREFILGLVNGDLLYNQLDSKLKRFGASFLELCIESQELLIPSRLDRVIFEKYAPKSVDVAEKYTEVDAFALVFPQQNGNDISVRALYDSLKGRRIERSGSLVSTASTRLGVLKFEYRGSEDKLEQVIAEELGKKGIEEHCIIRIETPEISDYLIFRFLIKRHGRLMNCVAPNIGGNKHEFITLNSDKDKDD